MIPRSKRRGGEESRDISLSSVGGPRGALHSPAPGPSVSPPPPLDPGRPCGLRRSHACTGPGAHPLPVTLEASFPRCKHARSPGRHLRGPRGPRTGAENAPSQGLTSRRKRGGQPHLLTVLPGRSRGGAWKACLTHSQAPKGGAERPVKSKMNARKGPSHTDASSRKQLSLCAVIGPEPGAFWSM